MRRIPACLTAVALRTANQSLTTTSSSSRIGSLLFTTSVAAFHRGRFDDMQGGGQYGSIMGGGGRQQQPGDPAATWVELGNIEHIYAVKEFERQVFARLQSMEGTQRLTCYPVDGSSEQKQLREQEKSEFLSKFRSPKGMNWKTEEKATKSKTHEQQQETHCTIECDLYVRNETGLNLALLFKEACDKCIQLSGDVSFKDVITTPQKPVVLCEVAETPASLRSKLWQLERAMRHAKDKELNSPAACVVCLNGEKNLFELAAESAQILKMQQKWRLACVPTFAIWTPYRNVYGEIKSIKHEIGDLKKTQGEIQHEIGDLKHEIGDLKKTQGEMLDILRSLADKQKD
eukprot:PhM_4_TR14264/c1_g1_i19/m.59626